MGGDGGGVPVGAAGRGVAVAVCKGCVGAGASGDGDATTDGVERSTAAGMTSPSAGVGRGGFVEPGPQAQARTKKAIGTRSQIPSRVKLLRSRESC